MDTSHLKCLCEFLAHTMCLISYTKVVGKDMHWINNATELIYSPNDLLDS